MSLSWRFTVLSWRPRIQLEVGWTDSQLLIDFRPFVGVINPFVTRRGPSCGVVFFQKFGTPSGTWNKNMRKESYPPNSMWVQNIIVFSGGCGAPFYERNLVGAHRDFKKGRFQDAGICVKNTWLRFACSVVGQKSQTYSWWNSCWWFPMGSNRIESVKNHLKQQTQGGFRDSLRATGEKQGTCRELSSWWKGNGRQRRHQIDGHMWGHPPKKHTSGADLNYLRSNKFLLLYPHHGVHGSDRNDR